MIGGQVCNHLQFWQSITSDKYILSLVRGVRVPFINNRAPKQWFLPSEMKMSSDEMAFVDSHLQQLINQGFVKELPGPHCGRLGQQCFPCAQEKWRFPNDSQFEAT